MVKPRIAQEVIFSKADAVIALRISAAACARGLGVDPSTMRRWVAQRRRATHVAAMRSLSQKLGAPILKNDEDILRDRHAPAAASAASNPEGDQPPVPPTDAEDAAAPPNPKPDADGGLDAALAAAKEEDDEDEDAQPVGAGAERTDSPTDSPTDAAAFTNKQAELTIVTLTETVVRLATIVMIRASKLQLTSDDFDELVATTVQEHAAYAAAAPPAAPAVREFLGGKPMIGIGLYAMTVLGTVMARGGKVAAKRREQDAMIAALRARAAGDDVEATDAGETDDSGSAVSPVSEIVGAVAAAASESDGDAALGSAGVRGQTGNLPAADSGPRAANPRRVHKPRAAKGRSGAGRGGRRVSKKKST